MRKLGGSNRNLSPEQKYRTCCQTFTVEYLPVTYMDSNLINTPTRFPQLNNKFPLTCLLSKVKVPFFEKLPPLPAGYLRRPCVERFERKFQVLNFKYKFFFKTQLLVLFFVFFLFSLTFLSGFFSQKLVAKARTDNKQTINRVQRYNRCCLFPNHSLSYGQNDPSTFPL